MTNEYEMMKEYLKNAKLASFFIIPLKYDSDMLDTSWLEKNAVLSPFTTMDITESVKKTINSKDGANLITRYKISRETVINELLDGKKSNIFYACRKGQPDFSENHRFTIHDMEIYIFHTQVAFLCVKVQYTRVSLLDTISNFGYAENNTDYYFTDSDGSILKFDFENQLKKICSHCNLDRFFENERSIFLEGYTYTTAVVGKRFKNLETMRQATFNLHLMVELENAVEDEAEEDINYVYAVKDQSQGSYRWGCCVTSQTISYIVADKDMDIDSEMTEQAENGLPVVLLALYQKFTCLRFKELISIADRKKSKRLKLLKKQLLEFQAYGTITPANISRWHNIKQTYKHVLETNEIPQAIDDISITLNLLSERQKEIETAKSDAIMGLITIFSIVSIPSSIIGLMDVLMGGNSLNIITTVISLISIVFIIILLALYKDRT